MRPGNLALPMGLAQKPPVGSVHLSAAATCVSISAAAAVEFLANSMFTVESESNRTRQRAT